ncbi:MAG TPA: class I SAM-dependent methyltransferase [Candidatus Dormibacteraeota bacterium]
MQAAVALKEISQEELDRQVGTRANRAEAVRVLRALADDPAVKPMLLDWLRDADEQRADYYEIRTLLNWISRTFQPATYLEIGIRRGWSMAQVAAGSPGVDLYGIDLWIPNYAEVENPGPEFVAAELKKVGHRGRLSLLSGNSHDVLPVVFGGAGGWRERLGRMRRRWPREFDLITVDGDHTVVGARQDLLDLLPRCSVGGLVVFDDLDYEGDERRGGATSDESLLTVWEEMAGRFPNFRFFANVRHHPGTGLTLRLS